MNNNDIWILIVSLYIYLAASNIMASHARSMIRKEIRELNQKIEKLENSQNESNQPTTTIDPQGSRILETITIASR